MLKENKYTHKAVGMHKNIKTSEWVVAVIEYNPLTGEVNPEVNETFNSVGNRDAAIEAFKLTVVQQGVFGEL